MLKRLRKLPNHERADLLPALWRVLAARICLSLGIQRALRLLGGRIDARKEPTANELDGWYRRAKAIRRVGARVPGVRCLCRSVALRWWMRQQGINARLVIAVSSGQTGAESHAWTEVNGIPIDDDLDNASRFRRLAGFSDA
ncbi:MAG: lasso peptide biosynthesis B2 protein [Wenzhouxiangella sp.]